MQMHQFSEIGKLTTEILHDISNPLTSLTLNIELLNKQQNITLIKKDLKQALNTTEQIQKIISSSIKQIKNQKEIIKFNINTGIKEAISFFQPILKRNKIKINFNLEKNSILRGNKVKFYQAISNLISNAIDSFKLNQKNKNILVQTYEKENCTLIKIKDNGRGIHNNDLNKIFLEFFTTKKSNKGTGIGLYNVKKIIENEFQGQLSVQSKVNKGTIFIIKIPVKDGK